MQKRRRRKPPSSLDWARQYVCPRTTGGWLWHCDEHDTHGNADTEDEAQVVAASHAAYFSDDMVGDVCLIRVWEAGHSSGTE